jgi:hypothetical protein
MSGMIILITKKLNSNILDYFVFLMILIIILFFYNLLLQYIFPLTLNI